MELRFFLGFNTIEHSLLSFTGVTNLQFIKLHSFFFVDKNFFYLVGTLNEKFCIIIKNFPIVRSETTNNLRKTAKYYDSYYRFS